MTWVVLELVPVRGENEFVPHPQNGFLVPFRSSIQNLDDHSVQFIWESTPRALPLLSSYKRPSSGHSVEMLVEIILLLSFYIKQRKLDYISHVLLLEDSSSVWWREELLFFGSNMCLTMPW